MGWASVNTQLFAMVSCRWFQDFSIASLNWLNTAHFQIWSHHLILGHIAPFKIVTLVIDCATVSSNRVIIDSKGIIGIVHINRPNLFGVIVSVAIKDAFLGNGHLLSELLRVFIADGVKELELLVFAVVSVIVWVVVGYRNVISWKYSFKVLHGVMYIQLAGLPSGGRLPTGRLWMPALPWQLRHLYMKYILLEVKITS